MISESEGSGLEEIPQLYITANPEQEAPSLLHDFPWEELRREGFYEDCGELSKYGYRVESMDFDSDDIKEFIIYPSYLNFKEGTCYVSYAPLCGSNCPIKICQESNEGWVNIGPRQVDGAGVGIEDEKIDGYYNVLIYSHISAGSRGVTRYEWQENELRYQKTYSVVDNY